jgi:hypothetical protein
MQAPRQPGGFDRSDYFTGTVIVSTTITATPRPNAAEIFFDTAKKVHMPEEERRVPCFQ